jgi:hypothetical protein
MELTGMRKPQFQKHLGKKEPPLLSGRGCRLELVPNHSALNQGSKATSAA